ncbi:MAG: polysaccharide deacetylase [Clostridia bacterium]|nr:polysaccharide deacetylase [Clostridia bacterium]
MIQKLMKKGGIDDGKPRLFVLCAIVILVLAIACGVGGCRHESGETKAVDATPESTPRPAPKIPLASSQNDLLKIAVEAKGSESKICYLTFDDGPTNTITPAILDVLKQYGVKATFFMLGSMIEKNPDMAKRVFDEGHLLANHTYSHDYHALYATGESFMAEVKKVEELIRKVTGEEPFKLVRFPGGGHNAGKYGEHKQRYKMLLQENGYYFADWNALNGDAEGGNRSADQLLARMQETATQKNIVVLMHDAAAKRTTADALPAIIEYLRGQGYEFRRMDEIPYYPEVEETVETSMEL